MEQHWVLLVGISSSTSRFFTPGREEYENTHLVFCCEKPHDIGDKV